jgi:hypothetical protein
MILGCKYIDKIDVGSPTNVDFGTGDKKVTKSVRPITVSMKNGSAYPADEVVNLLEAFLNDNQAKTFLKAKYDVLSDISKQSQQLSGSSVTGPFPTKSDWDKQIDTAFSDALKSLTSDRESIKKSLVASDPVTSDSYTVTSSPSILYISMSDGTIYGSSSKTTISLTDSALKNVTDSSLKALLKDGIAITTQTYDQKSGKDVEAITLPTNNKSLTTFATDFYGTSMGKKLVELIQLMSEGLTIGDSSSISTPSTSIIPTVTPKASSSTSQSTGIQMDMSTVRLAIESSYFSSSNYLYPESLTAVSSTSVKVGSKTVALKQAGFSGIVTSGITIDSKNKVTKCPVPAPTSTKWAFEYQPLHNGTDYALCTILPNGSILDYSNISTSSM